MGDIYSRDFLLLRNCPQLSQKYLLPKNTNPPQAFPGPKVTGPWGYLWNQRIEKNDINAPRVPVFGLTCILTNSWRQTCVFYAFLLFGKYFICARWG